MEVRHVRHGYPDYQRVWGSGDLGNITDALARKVLLRKLHLHIKKGINLSGMPSTAGVEKTSRGGKLDDAGAGWLGEVPGTGKWQLGPNDVEGSSGPTSGTTRIINR